jgi:hypothetical protein
MKPVTAWPFRAVMILVAALAVSACAESSAEAPLRSPTRDYPPPPPREPDGRTMGADNIAPEERLEQGAQVGEDSKLAPGWKAEERKGLDYDPDRRKGGAVDPSATTETEK